MAGLAYKKKKKKTPRASKLNLWFYHFTNEARSTTFLNRKESARAAGYKAKTEDSFRNIGYQNFIKLSDEISKWLDEAGLSENALKIKMLSLMDAKETKFFQKDGEVVTEREVEAIETQRRTLDMAMKVKGLYVEKLQLSGDKENPVEVRHSMDFDALKAAIEAEKK